MTRFEKIKQMNIEELTEFLNRFYCSNCCLNKEDCDLYSVCRKGIKKYLESKE